jgi:hypothetical protein
MLENEIVIFEIFFGMVHRQPNKGFQKTPHIPVLITRQWNLTILCHIWGLPYHGQNNPPSS